MAFILLRASPTSSILEEDNPLIASSKFCLFVLLSDFFDKRVYGLLFMGGMLAIKNREYVAAYSRLIFLGCEVRCYASMLALRALRSMNSRRGATSSPMSIEKMRSASAASAIDTCFKIRFCGSIVVSQSCSGFISPKPL